MQVILTSAIARAVSALSEFGVITQQLTPAHRQSPAPRNGGRGASVAQHKRRAKKRRAVRRAKRHGHY